MSRKLLVGLSVALCLALTGLATSAAAGRATVLRAGSATFTDTSNDANGAADITSVAVSNDASGIVDISLTAVGVSTIAGASGPDIEVLFDSDRNSLTGDLGMDICLEYWRDADNSGWDAYSWNGSAWAELPDSTTLGFARNGDTLTWALSKTEIQTQGSFDLVAVSTIHDAGGQITAADRAPDLGAWQYTLTAPPTTTPPPTTTTPPPALAKTPVKPVIGAPTMSPAHVTAGERVTVSFPVTRSDDGAPLTTGTLVCDPSVSGKVITHAEQFKQGTARLQFTIPKSARGKTLKVHVTIKLGSQSTTRIASYHVS